MSKTSHDESCHTFLENPKKTELKVSVLSRSKHTRDITTIKSQHIVVYSHCIAALPLPFFSLCFTSDCSRQKKKKKHELDYLHSRRKTNREAHFAVLWSRCNIFAWLQRSQTELRCGRCTNPKKSCWKLKPYSRWICVTWGLLVICMSWQRTS